ncbi:MAG: helix-turn-helix domain-containing protein [Desulfuromonadaceae bacterium]|nr:helix-turn-helix domain-containing protein [Desulfuromonadaceae bacterium]
MPFKQPTQLMTVSEFAKQLGVSRQHVYNLIERGPDEGGITAYRFGYVRGLRIHRTEVERYIGECRVDAGK